MSTQPEPEHRDERDGCGMNAGTEAATGPLAAQAGTVGQLRYRAVAGPARIPDPARGRERAAAVPSLMWPGWALRLLPPWRRDFQRSRALLAVMLAVFQQLVGINTIVYYAPTILNAAGFGKSAAILNSVGLASLSIIATVMAASVVDRIGRRPLMLGGLVGMVLSMALIGAVFFSSGLHTAHGKIIAVTCLAVFKFAFSMSWGPLVWVMLPELLPLHVRGTAMGGAVFLNWATNFLVSLLFPVLLAAGAGTVFELFAGCGLIAFFLTAKWLPETSRLSLERLERDQRTGNGHRD